MRLRDAIGRRARVADGTDRDAGSLGAGLQGAHAHLNGRTPYRAVGAEHAAVPSPGPDNDVTRPALVKHDAGARWHGERLDTPAGRAAQIGGKDESRHFSNLPAAASVERQSSD